ncbi:MAG: hypothetical protein QM645_09400 [Asticcacaulis sp.]
MAEKAKAKLKKYSSPSGYWQKFLEFIFENIHFGANLIHNYWSVDQIIALMGVNPQSFRGRKKVNCAGADACVRVTGCCIYA